MNTTEQAVPGTVVPSGSLISPGGAQGVQGIQGPTAVSADTGNQAVLGSDSKVFVPDPSPVIWSVRLRSYQALGNSAFEVDQANAHNPIGGVAAGTRVADRWFRAGGGTYAISSVVAATAAGAVLPGTNYRVSSRTLNWQLTTQESSMAAGDALYLIQHVEGSAMRELANDVHSVSILIQSSVAPLTFALAIRDNPVTKSYVSLVTIPTASTWTLLTVPNIAVFPSGNFSVLPGVIGYDIVLCFACGSTFLAPSTGSWLTGNYLGASGMSNWCGSALNSVLQLLFIQHEPGATATTLIDCPFQQAYDAALRYFCKTYDYDVAIGTANANSDLGLMQASTTGAAGPVRFPRAMAKIPTLTIYNPATGAANSVRLAGGTDYAVTAITLLGKGGFSSFGTATMPAVVAGTEIRAHYIADTGW